MPIDEVTTFRQALWRAGYRCNGGDRWGRTPLLTAAQAAALAAAELSQVAREPDAINTLSTIDFIQRYGLQAPLPR
jgi:hypothetical protein